MGLNTTKLPLILGLPREIRDMIYRLALVVQPEISEQVDGPFREDTEECTGLDRKLRRHDTSTPGTPPLLRVCHQIRAEGLPVFYGLNSFEFQFDQDTPVASNHLSFPFPFSNNTLLNTYGPESGFDLVEDLTVVWNHDCPNGTMSPVTLLNLGFVGIGAKGRINTKKPTQRIGDDSLDWDDQAQVLQAYLAALPRIVTRDRHGAHVTQPFRRRNVKSWKFSMRAIEDLVRAMRLFKQRCPRAMVWVEVKVGVQRTCIRCCL